MDTLLTRIERAAARPTTVTFVSGDDHDTVPWSEVHGDARALAALLQRQGIAPGDHIALLGPTTRDLVTAIQATWLVGAAVVVLPLPMRMASIDEFVAQTRTRVQRADTRLLLIDGQLAEFLEPQPDDPVTLRLDQVVAEARSAGDDGYVRPADDPQRLVILQFTSGSTSEPKGVMLPDRVLCANLDAIHTAAEYDIDDDVLVSWLPLYHDMGLVGMLTLPMSYGGGLVLGAPQDFLARPLRWLEWLSTYGGTATAAPNFAWVLATRALRRAARQADETGEDRLDLSRLEVALNGAEPIDPAAVRDFVEAAAEHGMRPGAVFPAFGMAELAIAGTFPKRMAGLQTDAVDQRVLEAERYAAPAEAGAEGVREFARLGRPVDGLEIRVVDASGRVLRDREVGELEIRGTSVTPGYYRNRAATDASFDGAWLRTGDLAYLLDGELVLCGRIKDVIILGGRNIFPEDVERAVADVDGVRAGNVVAFGTERANHREGVVVVAEVKGGDLELIAKQVHHRATEVTGAPLHDVVLVEAGALPKTSSGKLQRSLSRQRYENGELQRVPVPG